MASSRSHIAALVVGISMVAACGAPASPASAPDAGVARTEWRAPSTPEALRITAEEYASRRAALVADMGDGVLVVFGTGAPDFDYLPWAQNAHFRYLTGITEPSAGLIVEKRGGTVRERLFVQARNPARELWEGFRLGPEGARRETGVEAFTADRMAPTLDSLVAEHRALYLVTPMPADPAAAESLSREQQVIARILARHEGTRVGSLTPEIRRLRGEKSAAELDMIRRAVWVSIPAHREAMRSIRPGMNEFEIHGLVEYMFRRHGAERPAYGSIVGSGPNSTTLHYNQNDRYMRDGEVLLMDVGASYRGYAADITRTFPVNGRFSPEQREIYALVLAAQKAAEEAIRPGATWAQANSAANRVLGEGLARLGLIDSPDATYECEQRGTVTPCPQLRLFYMHGLGHGVGLDVHDPDMFLSEGRFGVGSAFTIEPGVYVRRDVYDYIPDTPANRAVIERRRGTVERYFDIGVRIEDVYLLTADGLDRVSDGAPREIDEIEALMREPGLGELQRHPEMVDWYRATGPVQP